MKLFLDFAKFVESADYGDFKTEVDKSVESHKLAFKAEESRLNGGKPISF